MSSYQVIARKYRPQRFSDVVGQQHVTQTLSNAIQQKRIAHAYLFVGPRGTGKTTIARIFAKCLNCTHGPAVDFEDSDQRAQEITEGRALDVIEIDGASNRGIEEIRDLRDTVRYAPATSKFKIYIIDEVHMLTKEAFNALLKTLEEPPEHVKFMFATTEPEKILPTILSRCQRFDLRRIPAPLVIGHLKQICDLEGVTIEPGALSAIARGAEGCMRDAESTLDQLISFCGNNIVEADVLSMFGLTARSQLLDLAGSVLNASAEEAIRQLNDLSTKGKDLARLLGDLLLHFRNLLIYKMSKGDMSLLEAAELDADILKSQSGPIDAQNLVQILDALTDCENRFRDAASKKIWVELGLLRAIEARQSVSLDTVLSKLRELQQSDGSTGLAASTPPPQKQPSPSPSQSQSPPRQEQSSAQTDADSTGGVPSLVARETSPPLETRSADLAPADVWNEVLRLIGQSSRMLHSALAPAHLVAFERNIFTLGFDPSIAADQLSIADNDRNRKTIEDHLASLGCNSARVRFIEAPAPSGHTLAVDEPEPLPTPPPQARQASAAPVLDPSPAPASQPQPAAMSKEDFKNDPLIKQALEIFRGQIVDVQMS